MITSKSLSLGQTMNTVGNQIEWIVKSGECECHLADNTCKACLTTAIANSDEIKKLNGVSSLRVAVRSLATKSGVGVLLYPSELAKRESRYYKYKFDYYHS